MNTRKLQPRIFKSSFAASINDMIEYKKALGFSPESYEQRLFEFDRFCCDKHPNEKILTKELIDEWGQKREKESRNSLVRRLCVIREFGKYLFSIGRQTYVYPSVLIPKMDHFQPYIYSDEELDIFFSATDVLKPHGHAPMREYVAPVIFRLMLGCGLRPKEARLLAPHPLRKPILCLHPRKICIHHLRLFLLRYSLKSAQELQLYPALISGHTGQNVLRLLRLQFRLLLPMPQVGCKIYRLLYPKTDLGRFVQPRQGAYGTVRL